MKTFWPQELWNEEYAQLDQFSVIDKSDPTRKFLERFLPHIPKGRCLEVGCFPGRYLAVFGEAGFSLNGVDLTPGVDGRLKQWLVREHFKVQELWNEDFFRFQPNEKFDLVYSLGFIEHFVNWQEALAKHITLVKPGGFLLITTPNFAGFFQRLLRTLVDRENVKRHYLPSMRPDLWEKIARRAGLEIVFSGYFGGFDFWVRDQRRNFLQERLLRAIVRRTPDIARVAPENLRFSSGYCGLVARVPMANG